MGRLKQTSGRINTVDKDQTKKNNATHLSIHIFYTFFILFFYLCTILEMLNIVKDIFYDLYIHTFKNYKTLKNKSIKYRCVKFFPNWDKRLITS